MNKIIKKIAILLSLCLVFTLAACDDDYKKPEIEVNNAHALRTTIEFDFTIWDEDDALVDLKVTLTGEHEGEKYTDTKTISIYGGDYEDNEETGEEEFVGEKKTNTFTGLLLDHTYEITMTGTYGERSRSMIDKISLTTSSKGSEEDPHEIKTVEDLEMVRLDTDGWFELKNDIDLKKSSGDKTELKSFFTSSKKFEGNFEGNDFTISNFFQEAYDQDLGLFGYIGAKGTINDLNIKDITIHSTRYTNVNIGAIAGTNTGTINNVHVTNVEITSKGPDKGDQFVGGFVGANKEGGNIENCSVKNVTISLNAPSNVRVGGFAGTNISTDKKISNLKNVHVSDSKVLVQVASENGYTADDEDVEIVLNIGGFIGDNRGFIEDASTDAVVGFYTDNSRTDLYFNSEEQLSNSDDLDVKYGKHEQTNRHNAITAMNLNIGGFAGANLSGSIVDGVTTTKEIKVEVPFLDIVRLGGFVGYNDYRASLSSCEYVSEGVNYDLVVDIDTVLNGSINGVGVVYIGHVVGINNNSNLTSSSVTSSTTGTPAQFTIVVRETTENDDYDPEDKDSKEFIYSFTSKVLDFNTELA